MDTEPIAQLVSVIRARGPIPCVRVSGAPSRWGHWDAVRYDVTLSADRSRPKLVAERAAERTYRSERAAEAAAAEIAEREGRFLLPRGRLRIDDAMVSAVLDWIATAAD